MKSVVVISKERDLADRAFAAIGFTSGGILSIPLSQGYYAARIDLDDVQIDSLKADLDGVAWVDSSDSLGNGDHFSQAIAEYGLYRIE